MTVDIPTSKCTVAARIEEMQAVGCGTVNKVGPVQECCHPQLGFVAAMMAQPMRTISRHACRRVRKGETSCPELSSKRRRTQKPRALQRSWDSDGDSSKDEAFTSPVQMDSISDGDEQPLVRQFHHLSDVIEAMERDLFHVLVVLVLW